MFKSNKTKTNKTNKPLKMPRDSYRYRDIPCFKDIKVAYWLLYNYSENKNEELNNRFIESMILKWYKDGKVSIYQSGMDNYRIDIRDREWEKDESEKLVFWFIKDASEKNNIVENDKVEEYYKLEENQEKLKKALNRVLKNTEEFLKENNYITETNNTKHFWFKKQSNYVLSEQLKNEYKRLMGLRNYLLNDTIEKGKIEISKWEEYYIFANLLGIEENVKQKFNKTCPEYDIMSTILGVSLNLSIDGKNKELN